MMTQERERRIDTSALLWGVVWRSVLWYTASGMVLGGLYGCAVVAVAMFSIDASEAIEPSRVWAVRATVTFFGVTGFAAGWAQARVLGREMRPLLGAVIGAMAGVALGGFYFLFAYMIALPMGAILGGAYGLAVGLVDAFLVAALTRALFFPLSEPRLHRRVVVWTSLLGVLIIPAYWFVTLMRSSGYAVLGGSITGSFWGDIFIYAGFPPLVLALVAQWLGGRLSAWYEITAPRTSAKMKEPTLRRALRRGKTRRIAYAALALAAFVVLAVGTRAYQSRTILTYIPSYEAVLSQNGEKAAALSHGEFAVYSLPEGRRLHTLPLSRAEVSDLDAAVWASNGRFLATSDGERVHVYDAAEEAEIASLPVEAASELAWSPDGSLLAVSTLEKTDDPFAAESTVRIWSRHSGRWMHTLATGEVGSFMAFDRDGHIFATTMDDGVQLWDVMSGRHLRTLYGDFESGISFGPDGRLMRVLRTGGHDDYSCADYSIAFSPDGELVASGGWGGVCVWRRDDGKLLWAKRIQKREVLALAFSPSGDLLVSGGIGAGVKVWRARDGTLLQTHERPEGSLGGTSSVAFDPETERVVSFDSGDNTVRMWPK